MYHRGQLATCLLKTERNYRKYQFQQLATLALYVTKELIKEKGVQSGSISPEMFLYLQRMMLL